MFRGAKIFPWDVHGFTKLTRLSSLKRKNGYGQDNQQMEIREDGEGIDFTGLEVSKLSETIETNSILLLEEYLI